MLDTSTRTPCWLWYFVPLLSFIGVMSWLYLPGILFSGPQGIHFIRQTDSISFMMNYGHGSWNFLAPAVFDLRNAPMDGKAAAEFPILYYLLALFRSAFGTSYTALRAVDLAFVLTGHVLLARLASRWLGSIIAGTCFSLWMFSSSVVIYYAANFLPDAPAYGCVLTGMCLVIEARTDRRPRLERIGILILVLAGLLKTPMTMYLVAYAGMLVFLEGATRWKTMSAILFGIVLIAGWNAHAILYNAAHHTHYFMTWAEPIWTMTKPEIASTANFVTSYWWTKYHHPTTWHFLLLLGMAALLLFQRIPRVFQILLSLLFPAAIAFITLFFRKFTDHDYYFLTVAPILALIALSGLIAIRDRFPSTRTTGMITLAMITLAVMGMRLGNLNLERRYINNSDPLVASICLEGSIIPVLHENAIPKGSRFIVIGDPTPNGSLLFLDRKGWTYDGLNGRTPPLDSLIQCGADYLIAIGQPDQGSARFQLLKHTAKWSLFRLNNDRR